MARMGRGIVEPRTGRVKAIEKPAGSVAEYNQAVERIPDRPYFDMRARAHPSPLTFAVVALPPCGCRLVGHGLEDSPVAILFCPRHRAVA